MHVRSLHPPQVRQDGQLRYFTLYALSTWNDEGRLPSRYGGKLALRLPITFADFKQRSYRDS